MTKIKILGAMIFFISITLAVLFIIISKENQLHNELTNSINLQKSFTQDISKNIFYIYKNNVKSNAKLDSSIEMFLEHMSTDSVVKNKNIITLWNEFYLDVQKFRDMQENQSLYSKILLEDLVNNIYKTNLKLIVEFDKIIESEQREFEILIKSYKYAQYALFTTLIFLLLFIFTKLRGVVEFIQKFLSTSKSILKTSTIKNLKPIKLKSNSIEVDTAKDNFNTLVKQIDDSIEYSKSSLEHSYKSIKEVEDKIKNLFDLIYEMNDDISNKELTKKEDAVIQSLEDLSSCSKKLTDLKQELSELINSQN